MKEIRKPKQQDTRSLSPDMKVAEVIEFWPQTIPTFVKMGFEPVTNRFLRNTIGRKVNLKQAAAFRNVDLNILLLNLETAIANPTLHNEAFIDPKRLRFDENTLPDLEGDLTILGLVPCPIRHILVEKTDEFIQTSFTSKNINVGWWYAAEGSGTGDVKTFIRSTAKTGNYNKFPNLFMAVGTELFLHDEYCRNMYKDNIFISSDQNKYTRPEFKKLADPNNKLHLQFAVFFSFYCEQKVLGDLPLPRTWFDLTNDTYRGKIVIPALNLPIIPDFLASLHYYFGDSLFIKFCQNVSFAMHPSQSSGRKEKKGNPAIFITPLHFSKIMKSNDGLHIQPEDGFVAVPSYIACQGKKNIATQQAIDYFLSMEYLTTYWENGSFIPNNTQIDVDIALDKIIFRPWDSLLGNIPDEYTTQLLRNFKLDIS
jgi:hypothetical protein